MSTSSFQDLFTAAATGDTSTSETPSSTSPDILLETMQSASGPVQDAEPQSPPTAENATEQPEAPNPNVEEVIVTDESGKKRIKVDFSDREKLKKYVSAAAGMRKFQAERDQLKSKLGQLEPEYQELKAGWSEMESAFSKGGIEGIINLLTNDPQGAEKYYAQKRQREQARENATPEQIARMDLEEKYHREQKEREKLQAEMEAYLKESRNNKDVAELRSLEAQLAPAFDKYRFAGKLGDPRIEKRYDNAVWNEVIEQLKQLPDDAELSQATVERAFRDVSSDFRRAISTKVSENTKKVIAAKKMTAQEKATAATVRAPSKPSGQIAELDQDISSSGFKGTLESIFARGFKF